MVYCMFATIVSIGNYLLRQGYLSVCVCVCVFMCARAYVCVCVLRGAGYFCSILYSLVSTNERESVSSRTTHTPVGGRTEAY